MGDFAQSTSVVDSLRGIINQYPHGVGTFRELLQNSDDAGASEQVFVLDRRTHPAGTGFDNGPAFLAYNNALVTDNDWVGLQKINSSPKRTDTGKTGKYGLGFRSTFHISDTPEILSGRYLATFDPLKRILSTEGTKRDFIGDPALASYLGTFRSALEPTYNFSEPLNATVIRLPLRTDPYSELAPRVVTADEIHGLLEEFIREEIGTVMLFLRHLSSIVVKEVDEYGAISVLATATRSSSNSTSAHDAQTHELTVEVKCLGSSTRLTKWLVVGRTDDLAPYAAEISQRVGNDVAAMLSREKLVPDIALAVPIAGSEHVRQHLGRLYTFLPLPITTGFPCLINASFSLTADRQSLRNAEEHAAGGSSHHVLVEWNKILFARALPVAWAALLSIGADLGMNVYSLWPSSYSAEAHGQAVYWNQVPIMLAREVYARSLPVWPRYSSGHTALTPTALYDEVLVIAENEQGSYLSALADLEVPLCRIPAHIQSIIVAAGCPVTVLSPSSAHIALLSRIALFDKHLRGSEGAASRGVLLDYLLSMRSLEDVVGLPLIVATDGYIAVRHSTIIESYIFDDAQVQLFGDVVQSHALIRDIPSALLQLLDYARPHNIGRPAVADIAAFVQRVHALDSHDLIAWSGRFWGWLVSLPHSSRAQHFAAVSSLPILATSRCKWQTPAAGIFPLTAEVQSLSLRTLLEDCGLTFLHPSIPVQVLTPFNCLRSIRDAPSLIARLARWPDVLSMASDDAVEKLQAMLALVFTTSALSVGDVKMLRGLRIYPVLVAGLPEVARVSNQPIDVGAKVYTVDDGIPLPKIPSICFVASTLPRALVRALGSDEPPLSIATVLQLTLNHFAAQTPDMQAVFVRRICSDAELLPRSITTKLSSLSFVVVANGRALARPNAVIDPHSKLHGLLDSDSERVASMGTQANMVNSLSQLRLLVTSLTPAIASECIARVSSSVNYALAEQLLSMMNARTFEGASLVFGSGARWIPCEDGRLYAPSECRDDSGEMQQQRALFDRVLAVSAVTVVSVSLRSRLGWNTTVPLPVLKRQFIACLAEEPSRVAVVQTLVQVLASRRLSEGDLQDLQAAAADRKWVPVDDDECSVTTFAVFQLDGLPPPFRRIHSRTEAVSSFLKRMGCCERPSATAILHILQTMYTSNALIPRGHICSLLDALDVTSLDSQTVSQLPVPSDTGELHPCSRTYYNDLGSRAYLVQLPDDARHAHDGISLSLARKLFMRDLSSLGIDEEDEEEDMGEALSTRISNVLRQYNQDQMPTEYLANAIDAGASSVSFLVDEVDFSSATERLIVPSLSQLQMSGALVIHNDASFSDGDWKGIIRVGRGNKRNQPGNIGRFGLGALAAYHFSDVTMVVSGIYFLLLDPSRRFLGNRASRRIKLRDMQKFFPDQLVPFVGLYGFEADTVDYNGTLFRLPLRSHAQAQKSELSRNVMGIRDAQAFLELQETRVKLAVLFNARLSYLAAAVRSWHSSASPKVARIWELKVTKDVVESNDPTLSSAMHSEIAITSTFKGTREVWRTGLYVFTKTDIPPSFYGLFEKYLLPETLSVGVALPRRAQVSSQAGSLFSHLPLPIETNLPFHVHASFILAEDRRSIRLDDTSFVNPESAYNRHLLAALVPNLYLSVLHHWPLTGEQGDLLTSSRFWPSQRGDKVSQIIVEPLYKTIGTDNRSVCESVTGARIAPSAAIFAEALHKDVVQSLELLQPANLVTKPALAFARTSMKRVDADTARSFVSQSEARLMQLYSEKKITVSHLLSLIRLVLGDDKFGGRLDGLRLLPLADGSLSLFRQQPLWGLPTLSDAIFMLPYGSESAQQRLFPASRFVHPDASGELRTTLPHSTLQVKPFTDDALAHLVGLRIQPSPEAILTEENADWIHAFWTFFSSLHSSGELHRDLRDRPMIPVSGQRRRHISVASCGGASTLLATSSTPPAVMNALTTMGASFIDKSRLPLSLCSREPVKSMTFSFSSALQFLSVHLEHIGDLTPTQSEVLREWIRDQIRTSHKLPPQDLRIALTLPLFRVRNGQEFAAANTVQMLPPGIGIVDVLPLTSSTDRVTPYDVSIANVLQISPMSFGMLGHILANARRSGQVIDNAQVTALSHLLHTVINIPRAVQEMRATLQVPNTYGIYVRPDTLYSRGVAMFVSAFDVEGRRRDVFIHQSLARFDPVLGAFGMHVVENPVTFLQCALAVQDANDDSKLESARVVYEYYRDRLPFVRNVNWGQFDAIKFIPRAIERRQNMPALNGYARELPLIVSPAQLLHADSTGYAWTQRARFEVEPTQRLLAEHPSLGLPTADEVVAHIRVLSGIPGELDYRAVVAKDVKASYKFLQGLSVLPESVKQALKRGDLFLNVDNHLTEWTWCSAADLILNASDDGPTYKMVRSSLKNYSKLLRALGVGALEAVSKPVIRVTGVEGELRRLRGGFDAKRRAEIGIDVVFVDSDDTPGRHPAHKMFMSACASYFDGLFYQAGMRESIVMGFAPLEVKVETSGGALQRCLDYLYTGEFAAIEREDLQILLDMLALADYWSLDDLKATVQGDIVGHLTPRVYQAVRGYAERYTADILLRSCIEWEAKNEQALRRGVDRSDDESQ